MMNQSIEEVKLLQQANISITTTVAGDQCYFSLLYQFSLLRFRHVGQLGKPTHLLNAAVLHY